MHNRDLIDFYTKEQIFPCQIALAIGSVVGMIHAETFNRSAYQDFFSNKPEHLKIDLVKNLQQQRVADNYCKSRCK